MANYYLAKQNKLAIIPVINKIDMEIADIGKTQQQLKQLFGIHPDDAILVLVLKMMIHFLEASARTCEGIEDIMYSIVEKIPRLILLWYM